MGTLSPSTSRAPGRDSCSPQRVPRREQNSSDFPGDRDRCLRTKDRRGTVSSPSRTGPGWRSGVTSSRPVTWPYFLRELTPMADTSPSPWCWETVALAARQPIRGTRWRRAPSNEGRPHLLQRDATPRRRTPSGARRPPWPRARRPRPATISVRVDDRTLERLRGVDPGLRPQREPGRRPRAGAAPDFRAPRTRRVSLTDVVASDRGQERAVGHAPVRRSGAHRVEHGAHQRFSPPTVTGERCGSSTAFTKGSPWIAEATGGGVGDRGLRRGPPRRVRATHPSRPASSATR